MNQRGEMRKLTGYWWNQLIDFSHSLQILLLLLFFFFPPFSPDKIEKFDGIDEVEEEKLKEITTLTDLFGTSGWLTAQYQALTLWTRE